MIRYRGRRIATVLLAVSVLVSACNADVEGFQGAGDENEIKLLQQPWGDLVVENQIVSEVLDELGYHTKIQQLSVPIGAQALANGQVDAYLGNWWPSQKSAYQQHLDDGDVDVLDTMVTGTTYAPAVPRYVAEKYGVRSLADLKANSKLFGKQFLGIEPGTPGNQYIANAINENAYGLGDWNLVKSSTAAMLAEVNRRAARHKPVVFLGWKPHWMNVQWDLVYLDDPDDVWPGAGGIRTVSRSGFAADKPNVARFLSQIKIKRSTASDWIYQLSKEGKAADDIARAWIGKHPDRIAHWLRGVRTSDGDTPSLP